MNIYLCKQDRSQLTKLPVVPSEFTIQSPSQNDTYTTVSQGDIKLLGSVGLKSISIQSFFPAKDYPFLKDKKHKGFGYVNIIEGWKKKKIPIRIIITDNGKSVQNILCSIDEFDYGIKDGTKDVYYTLSLSEFKLLPLKKRKK